MPNKKKAIIIGCGIAGPALALSLHKAGIESEIFEAQKALDDDAGLFHYLSPNGMNVFHVLGIYDKIKNLGYVSNNIFLNDENDKKFATIPEENSEKIYGASSIMIKRGVLTKALREEVLEKKIPLNFGKKLISIENKDNSTVIAHFEDGTSTTGDYLIGCDGIHSRTRHILMPNSTEPEYTKVVVAGGYTEAEINDKSISTIHAHYCKRAYLAYFILPNGEIWWWNGMSYPQKQTRKELEQISKDQWKQTIIDLFHDDVEIIQNIVRSSNNQFMTYPIYDIPQLDMWFKGNVCLVGDAAHATSPTNGQGAAMALEDAVTLAKCLRDVEITSDAFTKFQQLRKKRVEKIVKIGRSNGEGYFLTNSLRKKIRNLTLSLMLSPLFFKRMANSFFGYDVEWDKKIS